MDAVMVSQEMLQLGTARSVIRELFEYGKQRGAEIGMENVFDFSLGNPHTSPPSLIEEQAKALLSQGGIHGYTSAQGAVDARERFVTQINQRYGTAYHKDEMYLTMGAAAALTCVLRGLCCPEDEFVIFAPFFPEYTVFIQGAGGKVVTVEADVPQFQLNLQDFAQKLSPRTKAVLINTPNNPSGVVYTPETLQALSQILEAKSEEYGHPIYLISDEPYRELVYEGLHPLWVAQYYKDTIVCYSFSKSLSLAGERIGYVLVGREVSEGQQVYGALAGAGRAMGFVNAPSLFQQVCSHCSHLTSDLEEYRQNRRILLEGLGDCGFEIEPPMGAFYLFPKALEEDDNAFSIRAREFDLLVVPGSGFGVKGYFRLSYCVSRDKVERSIPQFRKLAQSYGVGV